MDDTADRNFQPICMNTMGRHCMYDNADRTFELICMNTIAPALYVLYGG